MSGAERERADGDQSLQGPVEEQGDQGGGVCGGGGFGRCGQRPRSVRHLAALLVEFGDALAEQVQEGGHGDRAGRELEEGEHLGARPRRPRRPRWTRCPRVRGGRATRRRRAPPSRGARRSRRGPRRAAASRGARCRRAVRRDRPGGPGPSRSAPGPGTTPGPSRPVREPGRPVAVRRGTRRRLPSGRSVRRRRGPSWPGGPVPPGAGCPPEGGAPAWCGGWSPPCERWRWVGGGQVAAWSRAEYGTSRGAVLPLTARKPKRNPNSRWRGCPAGSGTNRPIPSSGHIRGVRKRRRASS